MILNPDMVWSNYGPILPIYDTKLNLVICMVLKCLCISYFTCMQYCSAESDRLVIWLVEISEILWSYVVPLVT